VLSYQKRVDVKSISLARREVGQVPSDFAYTLVQRKCWVNMAIRWRSNMFVLDKNKFGDSDLTNAKEFVEFWSNYCHYEVEAFKSKSHI